MKIILVACCLFGFGVISSLATNGGIHFEASTTIPGYVTLNVSLESPIGSVALTLPNATVGFSDVLNQTDAILFSAIRGSTWPGLSSVVLKTTEGQKNINLTLLGGDVDATFYIPLGQEATITGNLRIDTQLYFLVNYQDHVFVKQDCSGSAAFSIKHIFSNLGSYDLNVNGSNFENSQTASATLIVAHALNGITIGSDSDKIGHVGEIFTFTVTVSVGTTQPIADLKYFLTCESTTITHNISSASSTTYSCPYSSTGYYTPKLEIRDAFGNSVVKAGKVSVNEPCTLAGSTKYYKVGETPVICNPPMGFNYSITFKQNTEVAGGPFTGQVLVPNDLNYVPGVYTIAVSYVGFSSDQKSYHVIFQNPIPTTDLTHTTAEPVYTPPGMVDFRLLSTARSTFPVPTNVTCLFYDVPETFQRSIDASSLTVKQQGLWLKFANEFNVAGSIAVGIKCSNDISNFTASDTILIKSFSAQNVSISHPYVVPMNDTVATYLYINYAIGIQTPIPGIMITLGFDGGSTFDHELTNFTDKLEITARNQYNLNINVKYFNSTKTYQSYVKGGVLNFINTGNIVKAQRGVSDITFTVFCFLGDETVNVNVDWDDSTTNTVVPFTSSSPPNQQVAITSKNKQITHIFDSQKVVQPKLSVSTTLGIETLMLPQTIFIENVVTDVQITEEQYAFNTSVTITYNVVGNFYPLNLQCSFNGEINNTITVTSALQAFTFVLAPVLEPSKIPMNVVCSNQVSSFSKDAFYKVVCFTSAFLFDQQHRTKSDARRILSDVPVVITGRVTEPCINASNLIYQWSIAKEDGTMLTITQPNIFRITVRDHVQTPGFYKFSLKVSFPSAPDEFIEDFLWTEFALTPLIAKIEGGSERLAGENNPVELNAGAKSYDPNVGFGKPDANLLFEWKCYVVSDQSKVTEYLNPVYSGTGHRTLPICGTTLESKAKITMIASGIGIDKWALIEVFVKKGQRTSTSLQAVKVLKVSPPVVQVVCKLNCQQKVVPTDITSVSLDVKCPDCKPEELLTISYLWKVYKFDDAQNIDVEVPWTSKFTSTATDAVFGADADGFDEGSSYLIKVEVSIPNKPTGSSSIRFLTNYRPYGGSCEIVPKKGRASLDYFYVSCNGWKDEGLRDKPGSSADAGESLTYRVTQIVGDEAVVASDGGDNITPKFKLQLCPEKDQFVCPIKIQISDAMLFPAFQDITVTVTSPIPVVTITVNANDTDASGASAAEAVEKQKLAAIESLSAASEEDFADKTPTEQTLAASTFASVINSVEVPPAAVDKINVEQVNDSEAASSALIDSLKSFDPVEEKLGQALEGLMSKSTESVDSALKDGGTIQTSDILQFASSIGSSVSKPDIVTENTQNAITNTALKLSEALLANSGETLKAADVWQALQGVAALQDTIINIGAPDITADDEETLPPASESVKEDVGFNRAELPFFEKFKNKKKKVNARKRLRQAKKNIRQCSEIWKNSFNLLEKFTSSSTPKVFKQKTCTLSFQKSTLKELQEQAKNSSSFDDGVNIELDGFDDVNSMEIKSKTIVLNKNIYIQGKNAHRVVGPVVSASITSTASGKAVTPKRRKTSFKNSKTPEFSRVEPTFIEGDASKMFYQKTLYKTKGEHMCVLLRPVDVSLTYDIFWRSLIQPSDIEFDFVTKNIPLSADKETLIACLLPNQVKRTGVLYIGIKPSVVEDSAASPVLSRKRRSVNSTSPATVTDPLTEPYNISVQSFSCLSWNGVEEDWEDDKCEIEQDLVNGIINCLCPGEPNSITASSFFVAPNQIDFSTVFSKFDIQSQAAVLGTIISVLVVALLVMMWARWKDRIDILQWGVTLLKDNFKDDNYYYLITVYTGFVREGSTMSNVKFDMYGEMYNTDIRELSDGVRKGFEAGSVSHFLMAVPEHLGSLQYLRIWHDNSGLGKYASWYLNRIEVVDIQKNESFVFMANGWLSIEDSTIDKVIPVAGTDNMRNFKTIFFDNARNNVTDDHVWISVLFRPIKSHFTRIQRIACCVSLLFLSMISNAMFFEGEDSKDRERTSQLELGPIKFSPSQLYISFISAIITAIPLAVMMVLFRKSKLRPFTRKKRNIPQWLPKKIKAQLEFSQELEEIMVIPDNIALKDAVLPSWCVYIGWFLVFASIFLSAFFLMLYSMQWGKDLSEEWLTSFLLTFAESVFLVDPFKVFALALIAGILFKALQTSKPTVYDFKTINKFTQEFGKERTERRIISINLPDTDERFRFTRARKHRDTQMHNAIKELILNILVLAVLTVLLYSNRDPQSFNLHKFVVRHFMEPTKPAQKYEKIFQDRQYFEWLNKTVIHILFPERDYRGAHLTSSQRLFSYGGYNLRVGPPRLRQVRAKPENITIPPLGELHKIPAYEWTAEDTGEYCAGWTPQPCSDKDELLLTVDAWKFTSALDIWGLPIAGLIDLYGGGGYIADLDINKQVSSDSLKELFDYRWIDRYTRAVFFEFTLYNIEINLFTYVSILTEFPATGGVVTYYNIFPFRPSQHSGSSGTFIVALEVLFCVYIVVSIIIMIVKMAKQKLKYFSQFWNIIEFAALAIALAGIILFFLRDQATTEALQKFKENDRAFVNFFHVVFWDYAFVYVFGIMITLATLRLLKAMAYTRITERVFTVLRESLRVFPGFATFILINMISFGIVGYVLFGRTGNAYKSFVDAIETMFVGLMGDATFRHTNSEVALSHIETAYFTLFVICVTIILTNLFVAILMDVMTKADQEKQKMSTRKELDMNIFGYMWDSVALIVTGKPSDYTYEQKQIIYDPFRMGPLEAEPKLTQKNNLTTDNFDTRLQFENKLEAAENLTIYHKVMKVAEANTDISNNQ